MLFLFLTCRLLVAKTQNAMYCLHIDLICQLPIADAINCYRLSGLRQQKFNILQFYKSKIRKEYQFTKVSLS